MAGTRSRLRPRTPGPPRLPPVRRRRPARTPGDPRRPPRRRARPAPRPRRRARDGGFFPSLLEPRRRAERALVAVVQEAYVQGVSTRRVDDLVKAPGLGGVSKSQVSRPCAELDREVE